MRRSEAPVVLALILLGVSACRIGPNPSRSPVATSPYGARVQIEFERVEGPFMSVRRPAPVHGELLAVNASGLMVDDGTSIVLFPYGSFARARLVNAPGVGVIRGNPPSPDRLEKARRYARYPFGLTDEQMAALLTDRGQRDLIIR